MKNFERYKVVNQGGNMFFYDTLEMTYRQITLHQAYILRSILKTDSSKETLLDLKNRYPSKHWSIKDIEKLKKKFSKVFAKNKKDKFHFQIYNYRKIFLLVILISIFFNTVIACAITLSDKNIFKTDNFFWNKNIILVFAVFVASYLIIRVFYELTQFYAAKFANIPSKLYFFRDHSLVNLEISQDGLYAASRTTRVVIYLSGIFIEFFLLTILLILILIINKGDFSHILHQALIVVFIKICIDFMLFLKSDSYYALSDIFNVGNLHSKSINIFQKHIEKGTEKSKLIMLYRLNLLTSLFLGLAIFYYIILPIKYQIYFQALNSAFYGAFDLNKWNFLGSSIVLILEILIDLYSLTFLLKSIFKDSD